MTIESTPPDMTLAVAKVKASVNDDTRRSLRLETAMRAHVVRARVMAVGSIVAMAIMVVAAWDYAGRTLGLVVMAGVLMTVVGVMGTLVAHRVWYR